MEMRSLRTMIYHKFAETDPRIRNSLILIELSTKYHPSFLRRRVSGVYHL